MYKGLRNWKLEKSKKGESEARKLDLEEICLEQTTRYFTVFCCQKVFATFNINF